jgi:hypothetical protein
MNRDPDIHEIVRRAERCMYAIAAAVAWAIYKGWI